MLCNITYVLKICLTYYVSNLWITFPIYVSKLRFTIRDIDTECMNHSKFMILTLPLFLSSLVHFCLMLGLELNLILMKIQF